MSLNLTKLKNSYQLMIEYKIIEYTIGILKSFHPETEGFTLSVSFFIVNTLTMQRSKEHEKRVHL